MDRAISHYTVHQQLGAGTFGSVHLVTPQGTDGDTLVATGETNHYNHVSTAAVSKLWSFVIIHMRKESLLLWGRKEF